MQIAREMAGYTLGQADMLRKAMGKKIAEEMARHREIFVQGSVRRGIAEKTAGSIFDLMEKFAEYGFNKSHSAAYGLITYQTAYLKAHFPEEFMAALMTTEMSNTDKLTRYIADAKAHGIHVLPPDLNRSERRFSVEKADGVGGRKSIRFGLEAIKGVGGAAVDSILEARRERPFSDVPDFFKRVSMRKVNKKVLESLVIAGALDELAVGANRPSLLASLESLIQFGNDEQEEKALGQSSLFDSFQAEEIKLVTATGNLIREEVDWPMSKKLSQEKQVVGFYISGHPMDHWQRICDDWLGSNTDKLKAMTAAAAEKPETSSAPDSNGRPRYFRPQRKEVQVAGLLSDVREITTKKGTRMAFAQLEDLYGRVEVIFFPDAFSSLQDRLKQAVAEVEPVVIAGELETKDEVPKILVNTIEWVKEASEGRVKNVTLVLKPSEVTVEQLRELKAKLTQFRGNCRVRIDFVDEAFRTRLDLPPTLKVAGTPQMVAAVNGVFGSSVVAFQ